jgi:hypothetical protein
MESLNLPHGKPPSGPVPAPGQFTFLVLWELTPFRRVLFLPPDALALADLSPLLTNATAAVTAVISRGAAAVAGAGVWLDGLGTALLSVRPQRAEFLRLKQLLARPLAAPGAAPLTAPRLLAAAFRRPDCLEELPATAVVEVSDPGDVAPSTASAPDVVGSRAHAGGGPMLAQFVGPVRPADPRARQSCSTGTCRALVRAWWRELDALARRRGGGGGGPCRALALRWQRLACAARAQHAGAG